MRQQARGVPLRLRIVALTPIGHICRGDERILDVDQDQGVCHDVSEPLLLYNGQQHRGPCTMEEGNRGYMFF